MKIQKRIEMIEAALKVVLPEHARHPFINMDRRDFSHETEQEYIDRQEQEILSSLRATYGSIDPSEVQFIIFSDPFTKFR